MGEKLQLVGKKFQRLTVLKESGRTKHNKILFSCLCDCGNVIEAIGSGLVSGNTGSCGCLQRERTGAASKINSPTHGLSGHPLYTVWIDIKRRCFDQRDTTYHNYGGRGIGVCAEWTDNFIPFYEWAMSNGWKRGLEVDRFPNNDGDYEPSNCRITTGKKNCNNRRGNVYAEVGGVRGTAAEWAEITGINRSVIAARVSKGVKGREAVFGVGRGNKFGKNK